MCSLIQVFLLCSCCLVFVLFLFYFFQYWFCQPGRKVNHHYIPLLSKGLFFRIICWMSFALMEPSKQFVLFFLFVFFVCVFFVFLIKLFTSFFYILNAVEPKASWSTSLVIKTVFLLSSNCSPVFVLIVHMWLFFKCVQH